MPTATEYQIDQSLATDIQGGASSQYYPSLQASCYQPKITDKLELVLGEKSLVLLSDAAKALMISGTMQTAFTDDSEVQTVSIVAPSVRWVFLGFPTAKFVRSKETKKVQSLASGMKFKEQNLESVAKLFLAAVIGNELIRDADGNVQVFTLALNSTKTKLIEDKDPEYRSVRKLNNWLIKKYSLDSEKMWLHLCSVPLIAQPTKLGTDKSVSIGAMYVISDMPQILHPDIQKDIAFTANSPEMKILVNDPFLLSEKNRAILAQLQSASDSVVTNADSASSDDDDF